MADYHAVLQRTLSGFSDPKQQLRSKLYERARSTIRRQLEGRSPPVVGDALEVELQKLELAIAQIENSYDPSHPIPEVQTEQSVPEPPSAPEPEPQIEQVTTEPVVDNSAPIPQEQTIIPESVTPPAVTNTDEVVASNVAPPEISEPVAAEPAADPYSEAAVSAVDDGQEIFGSDQQSFEAAYQQEFATNVEVAEPSLPEQPAVPEPPDPMLAALGEALDAGHSAAPQVSTPIESHVDQLAVSPPANQWLSDAETSQPMPEPVAPAYEPTGVFPTAPQLDVHTGAAPQTDPLQHQPVVGVEQIPPAYDPAEAFNQPPVGQPQVAPEIAQVDNAFGSQPQEDLVIPPAAGFGERTSRRPKKRGFLTWLLLLLLLGILAVGAYFGWNNRDTLVDKLGLASLIGKSDDASFKPTPVKTIAIKPEPEPTVTPEEEPKPVVKVERRLTEDGEEIDVTPTPTPATPEITPEAPKIQPAANGVLPVAQNAILYEEGSVASENTVDAGRVVWSVVQESPATGEPKEPAIRARIEIPSRKVVLIMTIKRNADKALPASHLIELIFAVPDDFSGGGIGQISRYVLKESEQGRGEALVAVPARIADGIFLVALNNLPEAKTQNETLLKSRDWIDIPMEYRTGRRALVTIEKGVPGDKVFKEVFAAWDAKQ